MAEGYSDYQHNQLSPLEARTQRALQRRKQFLDLVQGTAEIAPIDAVYDSEFFLAPGQVIGMFRETYMGSYIPKAGELVMKVHLHGFMSAGTYLPTATHVPDRAFLRRSILGKNPIDWSRQLGVVFQFEQVGGPHLASAESECGVALMDEGFFIYERSRILVDGIPRATTPTTIYKGSAAVVDEFTANVQGIVSQPTYRPEFDDLTGLERSFGDSIPLHDDT